MRHVAKDATNDGLTRRTRAAAQDALSGKRRGAAAFLPFAGPAIVASVAYVDPGNFATNIEAGAKYGYALLWVVLIANLTAMLFQALSAKLGIVTGRSLATHCREQLPKPMVVALWIASEVAAMATELAELLGASIGLNLLSGLPLMACLFIAAATTLAILQLERRGFRPIELVIAAFMLAIGGCYLVELWMSRPDWSGVVAGLTTPRLADGRAVTLAVGIVGATIMPHAIYLHSSLTAHRVIAKNDAETSRILSFSNREVILSLSFAGLVNLAMLCMAATVFYPDHQQVAEIETAYRTLTPLLGGAAAGVFLLSLLASGISSSVVGTMAGQTILQDFVGFRIPLWLRRALTMIPAFAVVAAGAGVTNALIMSQVILSLVLPAPMIAVVWLTSRRDIMGGFVNQRTTMALATCMALMVVALNVLLLALAAGWRVFGLDAG